MTRILFSFITILLSYGVLFSQEKVSKKNLNEARSIREKFQSDFLIATKKKKEKSISEIEQLDSISYYLYDTITSDLNQGERYVVDFQNKSAILSLWDTVNNVWSINSKDVVVYNDFDSSYFQTYSYIENSQQFVLIGREYRKLKGGINYFESYESNSVGQWRGKEKSETKEDSLGYLLLNANYDWDSVTKIWVGNNKFEYLHDSEGHTIFEQIYDWDSSNKMWVYNAKSEFDYDKFNNLNSKASYSWNSFSNEWEGIQKYESQFDVNFNELSYLVFDWNSSTKSWDSLSSTKSVFDLNNKLIARIKSNWDVSLNSFKVYQRVEYMYNLDLDLIDEIQTDITSSISYSKKEYSYLSQGKLNEVIYSTSFDSINWVNVKKDTIEYDQNQNPLVQNTLNWNSLTAIWENSPKTNDIRIDYGVNQNDSQLILTFVYNGTSFDTISKKINYFDNLTNLISEENYIKNGTTWGGISNGKTDYFYDNGLRYKYASYNWNSISNEWVGDWKSIHIINKALNGLSSEYIEVYNWDSVIKEWIGAEKTQYNYDANDKPTLIYNFAWNPITKNWKNFQKIEYINPLNFDDYIKYVWSSTQYVWVKSIKSEYFENDSIRKTTLSHWKGVSADWSVFSLYTEYFYQPVSTSNLNEFKIEKCTTIFPNPIKGYFTIQNAPNDIYSIVNCLGQEVMSFEISDSLSTNINIDSLQSGYYLISPKNRTKNQQTISIIIE